jgi:hypothetical protein
MIGDSTANYPELTIKTQLREDLEEREPFQNIPQDRWLDKAYVTCLNEIVSQTREIRGNLSLYKNLADGSYAKVSELIGQVLSLNQGEPQLRSDWKKNIKKLLEGDLDTENHFKEKLQSYCKNILRNSTQYVESICNNYDISDAVLTQEILFCCPSCHKLLSEDTLEVENCECGQSISRDQSDKLIIHQAHDDLLHIVDQNAVLEYQTQTIFDRMDSYESLTAVKIQGSSGVSHEIDVLAENQTSDRILVECKDRDVNLNDVSLFLQKVDDIPCNQAIMLSSGDFNQKSKKLCQHNSTVMIENFDLDTYESTLNHLSNCLQEDHLHLVN